MTKRYTLVLRLDVTDGESLIDLEVTSKKLETVQQLIRLAMSDLEKVEQLPAAPKPKKWGRHRAVIPPEPMPTVPQPGELDDI